jgi:hypothetical protein
MTLLSGHNFDVLAFDGGGYRCLSEIFLLSRFLGSIVNGDDENEDDDLSSRPCDHFDLICGTSSGGLLAILFGRLRMSCSEAREAYETLGRLMFAEEPGTGKIIVHLEDANRDKFRKELERIVSEKVGKADAPMDPAAEDKDGYCYVRGLALSLKLVANCLADPQTFVTTSSANSGSAGVLPYLVRNYPAPKGQVATSPHNYSWKIVEAALATMATPSHFAPFSIHFQGLDYAFQDAGPSGFTNPSRLAHDEALCLFPKMYLNTLVSLGAGLPKLLRLQDRSPADPRERYIAQLVRVAHDTERVHNDLASELRRLWVLVCEKLVLTG